MPTAPEKLEPKIAPSGLMSLGDAAVYLGMTPNAIRWAVRTKKLKAGKFGKYLKFKKADVDKYIEDCFGAA